MHPSLIVGSAIAVFTYISLQLVLHATQNAREPLLLESTVPFLDSALGILRHKANYLAHLR